MAKRWSQILIFSKNCAIIINRIIFGDSIMAICCSQVIKIPRLQFRQMTRWEKFLTWVMTPIMYLLQGTFSERPQETHLWNNCKIDPEGDWLPNHNKTVRVTGSIFATTDRWLGFIPIFHMPIFGGWREYVVLLPADSTRKWYVGWQTKDAFGVSMIPVRGAVRVLRGPGDVCFFAVTQHGLQIPLKKVGEGMIGHGGEFAKLPLR